MIWPELQTIAQVSVERVLNTLPQQLLVVVFAWGLLKLLGRKSSRTRFAVWFLALVAVVGVALAGDSGAARSLVGGSAAVAIPESWAVIVFALWAVVAGAAIARLAAGLWRLRALRKSCAAIDATALDPAVHRTIAEFSASRTVSIAASENVRVPAAIGFLEPMIVIPTWALKELSAEELRIILVHEHAHLRHWDDWTNLFQKIVRAVFFFHPAVWWIESRMSLEREMACDDVVLAETGNPQGYAQCLIGMLERNCPQRAWAMAQAVVHKAREASLRLARILDGNRPTGTGAWKPAIALMGVFTLVCAAAAPLTPRLVAFGPSAEQSTVARNVKAEAEATMAPQAMLVPAALKLNGTPKAAAKPAKAVTKRVQSQTPEARTVLAGMRLRNEIRQPMVVQAKGNDAVMNGSAAFMVVQTTQYVDSDSHEMVWSVRVWRVVWVTPAKERAPASKST